jgi:hypothetical protein
MSNDKPKTKALARETVDGEKWSVHKNGNSYELWSRTGRTWIMHGCVSHPDNITMGILAAQEEMHAMLAEWR